MNIARTCVFEKPGPQEASLWVCWSAPALGGTCATSTPLAGAPPAPVALRLALVPACAPVPCPTAHTSGFERTASAGRRLTRIYEEDSGKSMAQWRGAHSPPARMLGLLLRNRTHARPASLATHICGLVRSASAGQLPCLPSHGDALARKLLGRPQLMCLLRAYRMLLAARA